ncbi:MAG: zinc protease [Flavobacteriales bacterium]|jgi:zinc protease
MIEYQKFTLENGLTVLFHQDKTTPIVAFNILYDVGAKDENPDKTGFAHLFEHLMFGGSKNIENFDTPLQSAGGQSNAFTSNDITNYYVTLPKENLETAFWLDSDRLDQLAFTPKSLEVQRSVVIEEFKQRYLNQPYGDLWLELRPLAYQKHPYQWATIGKEVNHIEEATMEDVKAFFYKHYGPQNAILCVAGDVDLEAVKSLTNKWFGGIDKREKYVRNIPSEPKQNRLRKKEIIRDVPADGIYMTFHMCDKRSNDYCATDLISDVLSGGQSCRFFTKWIMENPKFTDLDGYITGSIENGLFVISGKPADGVSLDECYEIIWKELELMKTELASEREMEKILNKVESSTVFGEMSVLNKAMSLCHYELLGDANLINEQLDNYRAVNAQDLKRIANDIFTVENCSVLYYKAKK